MTVQIQCDFGSAVSEPFRDDLWVDIAFEKMRRVRMSKAVERDVLKCLSFDEISVARLHGRRAESTLGIRHHLYLNAPGGALSGGRDGPLFSAHRRLVDESVDQSALDNRYAVDGIRTASTVGRVDPSFRPRQPIYE